MKAFALSTCLLLSSCGVLRDVPPDGGLRQQLIEMFSTVGDAVVRLEGTKIMKEKAPDLLPLIDRAPTDGVISLTEVVSFIQNADTTTLIVLGAIYFQ